MTTIITCTCSDEQINLVGCDCAASWHGQPETTADGRWLADGSFSYDYKQIALQTGHAVETVRMRGVAWCRNNRKPVSIQPTHADNS